MNAALDLTLLAAAYSASIVWCLALLLPSRPFGMRERLEPSKPEVADLDDITVLIPARNEATTVQRTLVAVGDQRGAAPVVIVDDQSTDATARVARETLNTATVVTGEPPPPGWIGKVWALEQGLRTVQTPFVLLLDADIELRPGIIAALKNKAVHERLAMVSLLANLNTQRFWERILMPAYVYFFKFMYPFALVNSVSSRTAAAAGGCILIRREVLEEIGGFASLKSAIIDDCTLAKQVKAAGHGIWLGVSKSVISHREYANWVDILNLVTRSAFAELKFSTMRLLLCTLAMLWLFICVPLVLLIYSGVPAYIAAAGMLAMFMTYVPVLRFYKLWAGRALTLPLVALLYLAMTWHSAVRYWFGTRTVWKGRCYESRPRNVP
ncbi:MAG: glycosyltransferase [Gammaproteobacteria bacterium]|nr:glycosyltransferase [Gammaproteobacteria bacterium]